MTEHKYPYIQRTRLGELIRTFFSAPMRAMRSGNLLLLIALGYFHASPDVKALVTAAPFIGLVLSPLSVYVTARSGMQISKAKAAVLFVSALALAVAAWADSFSLFVIFGVLAMAGFTIATPLITAMWHQNIPADIRGHQFSQINWIGIAAGIGAGVFFSWWLDDISKYKLLLGISAGAIVLAAYGVATVPGNTLKTPEKLPFHALSLMWKNRLFGYICLSWTLMGVGNLMTLPMRVEYVASGDYGMFYSPARVIILTQVIPQAAMLVTMLFSGKLFDKLNFISLRIVINFVLIAGIALYFTTSFPLQIIGNILFGLALGFGFVTWNLWVTKIAPHEHIADYMSVHTFLAGLRGLAAPFIAYYLIAKLTPVAIAYVGMGSIIVGTLLLLPIFSIVLPNDAKNQN